MKIASAFKTIGFLGVVMMGTFGCSSDLANQYSPEQVINNALKEEREVVNYYAEVEMSLIEEMGKEEKILLKEWVSDGKRKIETKNEDGSEYNITINDGKKLISYQPDLKQAFMVEDEELLTLNQVSPKQQAEQMLSVIKNTHEISAEGEEEIIGRTTYHLKATAKEHNSLLGDQEIWVDKENWLVLKSISSSGDFKVEMTYTKLNLDANIPEDTFKPELPDDVQIQDLLGGVSDAQEITLEEAVMKVEKPFLYVKEENGLTISRIEVVELEGEFNRNEVNIDYQKDGLPYFSMTVFQSPEEIGEEVEMIPGERKVKIRNQEGFYMEMNDFRSLGWQEEGLNYSILFIDSKLTLGEISEILSDMELAGHFVD